MEAFASKLFVKRGDYAYCIFIFQKYCEEMIPQRSVYYLWWTNYRQQKIIWYRPGPYNLLLHAGVTDNDCLGTRTPDAGRDLLMADRRTLGPNPFIKFLPENEGKNYGWLIHMFHATLAVELN